MQYPLNATPDSQWMTYKLNEYGCFFNDTAVNQLLELARKMEFKTGEVQQGIKCILKNRVVDATAISDLEAQFKAWKMIWEHPPY
jgi:hypothetical protein